MCLQVYEVNIEDKGKNFIFMRLSSACVEELGLSCDHDFFAQVMMSELCATLSVLL